jgi:hypothetical protein
MDGEQKKLGIFQWMFGTKPDWDTLTTATGDTSPLKAAAGRLGSDPGESTDPACVVAREHGAEEPEPCDEDELPAEVTPLDSLPIRGDEPDAADLLLVNQGDERKVASAGSAGSELAGRNKSSQSRQTTLVAAESAGSQGESEAPPACNGFEQFQQAGGSVRPTPPNLGHLSHVYQAVRPELVRMLCEEFAVRDSDMVQVNRCQWEGCGMRSPPAPAGDGEPLRAEFAIHRGGKDVNQDAVGLCEGILWDEGRREPFVVIAVADGVTRALYSEFGALLAVGAAIQSSVRFLDSSSQVLGLPLRKPEAERFARCLCRDLSHCSSAMRALQNEIETALAHFVQADNEAPSREARGEARVHLSLLREPESSHLSTTVIAVCATARWFATAGFGNGVVWAGFASGDSAALWIPDSLAPLDCHLGTNHVPRKPSYAWSAALEPSGMVAVGAGTDGIPAMSVLRDAFREAGPEALTQDVLERIIQRQLARCSADSVDNAALARIDICATHEED